MTFAKTAGIATALVFLVTTGHAATIFTDRTAWETAMGGPIQTETFDNVIPDADVITLDNGIVSSEVVPGTEFGWNQVSAGTFLGRNGTFTNHPDLITWDFGTTIQGFFADFDAVNVNGLAVSGDFDGTGVQTISIWDAIGSGGGFGLISTGAGFTSLSWTPGSSPSEGFRVDNFSSTPLSTAAVPLPMSGLLLAGALGVFGLQRKRKV